ncbi:MAG: YggT family protein [Aerococcus sp.]|nr:YggT family protein [Aerococcus sp.]
MITIILLLQRIIHLYSMLLVIYALLTWFPGALDSTFGRLISRLVEPYLSIFDELVPSVFGMSFSVVLGVLLLELASQGLYYLI